MRNLIFKIALVILVASIGVIYLNDKRATEVHQKMIKERNKRVASVLSQEPGKYYLVALGMSTTAKDQFGKVYNHQLVDILSGYYANQSPSNIEIRDFNVNKKPIYLVFDTKKEVFRTNEISKLKKFLIKMKHSKKVIQNDVKDVAIAGILSRDHFKKEDIKIQSIKIVSKDEWVVLYQVKDKNGLWTPSGGYDGMSIKKDSSGKLQAIFERYNK